MHHLLEESPDALEKAIDGLLRQTEANSRLGEYIVGEGRAGWKFLLPIREAATVLDLGCGWGGIAHSLAKSCGDVIAMDSTMERMRFLKQRANRDGLNNLNCVCSGDGNQLPFANETFDIIIINGVLEWVPSGRKGDPGAIQKAFLGEVRRVLRDNGTLFLGIENRYSWKTWFRQPDGHTGLRYVPWLPRRLADLYSQFHGRGSYRNYLYGRAQYQTLLEEVGFQESSFYVPLPGYDHPSKMVPLSDNDRLRQSVIRPEKSSLKRFRQSVKASLTARFPDAYGIVTNNPGAPPSFLDSFCEFLAEKIPRHFSNRPEVTDYRINGEMGMVTVILADGGNGDHARSVLKLPLHSRSDQDVKREADNLTLIQEQRHPYGKLRSSIPSAVGCDDYEGQTYALFSYIRGHDGDIYSRKRGRRELAIDEASKFAMKMHVESKHAFAESTSTPCELVHNCAKQVLTIAATSGQAKSLELLVDKLSAQLSNRPTDLVLGHGDFKLANCIFDPATGYLNGVIDWGAGLRPELPLFDLSFLIVDACSQMAGKSLPNELESWISGEWLYPEMHRILAKYAKTLNLTFDDEDIQILGAYQWLKRMTPLADGYESRRFDYRYVDSMFQAILPE
ncbi:methyltransferase domain-containing protein [Symmachiella macrocystis]|nr:methyltransferase domain-containing protein [Symmachiella macrocystis]